MSINPAGNPLRPVWWGVFISLGAFLALFLAQSLWKSHLEASWSDLKTARERDLREFVQSKLDGKIEFQRGIAEQVLQFPEIRKALEERSPANLGAAFRRLELFSGGDDLSIDVLDAKGESAVWEGRSVVPSFRPAFDSLKTNVIVRVSQASLHRYLSVGVRTNSSGLSVFVSSPLETNYPVSNRFVSRRSLAEDLAQESGLSVRFVLDIAQRDTMGEAAFAVPLRDRQNKQICYVLALVPTVATELQKADRIFDSARSVFGACALCLVCIPLYVRSRQSPRKSLRTMVALALLWGLRLGWKLIGFPSLLVGGFLFDPAIQASPFPLGLAGSLGELVLSALTVLVTVIVLFLETTRWHQVSPKIETSENFWRTWYRYGLAVLLTLLFQLVVRGYGAAIRSFVFDSTIRYEDPLSLIPTMPTIVMHLNILMMTVALLMVCVVVFMLVSRLLRRWANNSAMSALHAGRLLLLFVLTYGVYLLLDDSPQLPWFLPAVIFVIGLFLTIGWDLRERGAKAWMQRPLVSAAIVIGAAFVVAAFALDAKTHEKEHERVQLLAEETLRSVDNWLSLVVSESLRAATTSANEQLSAGGADSTFSVDIAFGLWAQALMSKEGFNSAVVVYNSFGKEISRFSAGLTSYEQTELLSQVFHKEEEALLVVDRKVAEGTIKYYGEWGSVLDAHGQPLGTVAVLVSASQRTLFRGEAPEQLRSTSKDQFEDVLRRISISEYRSGVLWSTNDPLLFKGVRLSPSVEREFQDTTARFFWSEQELEGRASDVLYARDDADRSRIISLSVASLDLRWHLFNLVKMIVVHLLFLVILACAMFVSSIAGGRSVRFGFRSKLITAFAILSVLPLVLMAIYNRQLAVERLDENLTKRLSQDLDIVQQRFSSAIVEEQDFTETVTNDFCEVVASDLGIDFSVYTGSLLKASSRPELYRASILDSRLTGSAYVNSNLLGKGFYKSEERIGEVDYIVGYRPLIIGDSIRGVLAVPALYRQQEIDEELTQRNAFVLGAYALVVVLVIGLGVVLAHTLSKPLRDLSSAARSVGKGDLDVILKPRSADEVGDLMQSFNTMTTELKASRARLARAERELAWKEMAKQVAHEIKNPLTPIKLSIQHLVEAYKQGAKDFGEILQRVSQTVVEQIEVLTRIASEFSNFARMPERHFERVDLVQLLTESINLFKEVNDVVFRTNLSETPSFVIADKDELRRVFINIIRNSIQAMEKGGTISVVLTTDNRACTIRISDTGSGVPENLREKVFQPNFSTKTDGTGLGLAIAQKVIEDLDGTISLQSKIGEGTIIEMNIPLRHG
jgi:two-component system, NtrC family, nitrogen regulation sensor histidine kinase NtrY